jgi:Tfp pilus assembly protein PilX
MTRRLVQEQDGVTLVLTLMTMIILSITTAAVLTATAVNHRTALKSTDAKQAFALAEQALADAEGVLYTAINAQCSSTCVPAAGPIDSGNGSISYSGSQSGTLWTLTGTGTVDGVSRTVSAQANAGSTTTTTDPTIWNYLYVASTGTCMSLSGGSQIKVPLYTPGSVCISGGSDFTGSDLEVGQNLSVPDSGSYIGTSSSKIAKLGVGGTCYQQKSGKTWPCNGSGPTIYASTVNTTVPSLTEPTYDLTTLYNTQKAATISGCPSNFPDNDSTLNNSDGTVNVFPTNSSYDCKITSGGSTIGELKWNSVGSWSVGTMQISGVVVIDGSLDLSGGMHVEYTGGGTIYFTGTAKVEGGTSICGGNSGSNDCTGWDPGDYNVSSKASACATSKACNVMVLVANCRQANTTDDTKTVSGTCFDLTGGSTLQTGSYARTSFVLEGGSTDQGPVITNTMTVAGGTNFLQMLPFDNLPTGTPANTTTVVSPPSAPTHWAG